MQAFGLEDRGFRRTGAEDSARICRSSVIRSPKIVLRYVPENRGIYTQSDSPKKSSRNIWSLAVVSVDQRY